MNILVIIIGAIGAVGVFMVFRGLAMSPRQDLLETRLAQFRDTAVTLEEIELEQPFTDRFLRPAMERVGAFLNTRVGRDRISGIQNKLSLAGRPGNLTVNGFISVKVAIGIIAAILGFIFWNFTGVELPLVGAFVGRVVLTALTAVGGYLLPDLWLRQKVGQRQKEIRLALPNALDLLTISVEAGLGFDAALVRVTEKYKNGLSEEFTQVLNEVRLGRPRLEALDDMGRRVGVEELHSFIQALIQSEQLGVGIAKVLRIQSEEMRRKRRQRAEEQAAQASLKMLFPMIIFIFPTIFIVLMGPAVLVIFHTFAH
ncbi:MAG TPA: type II secretion system F family protein [Candidatus Dormibacteraeota bacterium]|jgi:tight adherence protein C|nr:type II secretion system F family protein [Candidatus Dormibacteraeota bacterium]